MSRPNNFIIKLKPTILIVYFFITSVIVSFLLFMQYNSNKDFVLDSTTKSFKELSSEIIGIFKQYENESIGILGLIENFNSLGMIPTPKQEHSLDKFFTTYMANKPYVYAMYVGHKDGTFYEIINLNDNQKLLTKYSAPEGSKWLVVKILRANEQSTKYFEFLDKNLSLISSKEESTTYNPSLRPWYLKALQTTEVIKTEPYIFDSTKQAGITYAKKVQTIKENEYVLGLDITLDSINEVLEKQDFVKDSEMFLYKGNGDLITYKNVNSSSNNETKKNIDEYYPVLKTATIDDRFLKINDRKYFHYKFSVTSDKDYQEYLQIITPLDNMMLAYEKEIFKFMLLSLGILTIIGLPLILYSSNLITKPISKIYLENEKIKNRKYDEVEKIDSFIVELNELSGSLLDMSQAIKTHEKNQEKLMDSFIKLIATAIDEKSKYTGGHCERVPELSLMLMKEANKSKDGIFKDFKIENDDQLREVSISAWLHDCGKVTTPEYVVDKATKLETIYNRIHEIRTRFEVIYRDLTIEALKKELSGINKTEIENWLKEEHSKLEDDFKFIATANVGDEFMKDEDKQRVKQIAQRVWMRHFDNTLGLSNEEKLRLDDEQTSLPCVENLLSDKKSHIIKRDINPLNLNEKFGFKMDIPENLYNLGEVYNLSISRGTLTNEERYKIQEHIVMTIKMLEELPFPKELKNVPKFAGAHHETLIGTGYPKKLVKDEMPLAARIIAISDVFEALTASDRPYKSGKKLSEAIKILSFMVKDQHIDQDLFRLFLESGIYKEYANKYLKPEQIDEVDINQYLK